MITEETNVASQVLQATMLRGRDRLEYILFHEIQDGRDSYSIQAIHYRGGRKLCQATACDVSCEYGAAREMFDVISEGRVEPIVLCDVVYDLLP